MGREGLEPRDDIGPWTLGCMTAFSEVNSPFGWWMEIWWVRERDYDVSRILWSSVFGLQRWNIGMEREGMGWSTSVACGSRSWAKVLLTAFELGGGCFLLM